MRSAGRSSLLALAVAISGLGVAADRVGAAARSSETLGFVHVGANVGGASGGHAALVVGEQAYHYEFHGDGTLRIDRLAWRDFLHQYGSLENRSLRLAQVPVSPETQSQVARRFSRLLLVQERHLDRLEALALEARYFAARATGAGVVELEGGGFFEPAGDTDPAAELLRRAVAVRLPPGFLDAERRRVGALLHAGAARESQIGEAAIEWDAYPRPVEIEAERLRESLQLREALDVLAEARSVRRAAILDLATVDPELGMRPLDPIERARLQEISTGLVGMIARLARSARPDRGFAMLVAIARHHVVLRSLAANRLLVLDPLPVDAEVLDREQVARRKAALSQLARQQRRAYAAARHAALGAGAAHTASPEPALRLLELGTSRYYEIEGALNQGRPLRGTPDAFPVPARVGPVSVAPSASPRLDAARAKRAESRLALVRRRLQEAYGYGLFAHNCATELVRGVGSAFDATKTQTQALGGELEPAQGLGFVPAGLIRQVERDLPVSRVTSFPSHRTRRLEEMAATEPALAVWLRESNTLTSALYSGTDGDGAFLFFTDEVWPLRPLLGALNLGVALGRAGLGLLTAPFDRGHGLMEGLHGAVFSVPELFFVNIRKGTFDFVPREEP